MNSFTKVLVLGLPIQTWPEGRVKEANCEKESTYFAGRHRMLKSQQYVRGRIPTVAAVPIVGRVEVSTAY